MRMRVDVAREQTEGRRDDAGGQAGDGKGETVCYHGRRYATGRQTGLMWKEQSTLSLTPAHSLEASRRGKDKRKAGATVLEGKCGRAGKKG